MHCYVLPRGKYLSEPHNRLSFVFVVLMIFHLLHFTFSQVIALRISDGIYDRNQLATDS